MSRLRSLFFLFVTLAVALPTLAAIRPGDLKCEFRSNPFGIDVVQPRLSWLLTPSGGKTRGESQSAYQVLVASSPDTLRANRGDLWDTGKVASDQSIHVAYAGKRLESRIAVWWKVRVWDQSGKASDWSESARWSMGLLVPEGWKAKWIGRDSGEAKPEALMTAKWITAKLGSSAATFFVQEFDLGEKPANALAMFVGSGTVKLFVNGKDLGSAEGSKATISSDITWALRPGKNVFAVSVDASGAGAPALIGAVEVDAADGARSILRTDAAWTVAYTKPLDWPQTAPSASLKPIQVLGAYGIAPYGEVGWSERQNLPARMIRKPFEVKRTVKRATAYISGMGWFEFSLNGAKVSNDVLAPALSDYDKRVFYLTYDVTSRLKPGANAIGVILGSGRFFAPRHGQPLGTRSFGYPKLLMQIEIEYSDGSKETIASDQTWKLTTEGPIVANNEYDGERYDARREINGWDTPSYDDQAWQAADLVAAPRGQLSAQMIEPIRVTQDLKPIKITRPRPGMYVFDMGQNMVGWVQLNVSGAKGTAVKLRHSETLRPDGLLYTDNLRTAEATDVYTLKGEGKEVYEPRFVYHGFRYVEVTGFPGEPKLDAILGRVVHDDIKQRATFESSNSLLNQIHKNIVWGTMDNYHSIPTDCPQRDERQGWLGDRAASSRGDAFLFDTAALYAKWVGDMEDSQREDGAMSDVNPAFWPIYNDDVTWPNAFIALPQHLYDEYGDKRVIERHYAAMKRWVTRMNGFIKQDLQPKDTYGDWCVPPENLEAIHSSDPMRRTEGQVLATAYYYNILRTMARNARMLSLDQDAAEFDELALRLKAAFNRQYFHADTNTYANASQTSSILPLAFGMVPEDRRAAVFQAFVRKLEEQNKGHVSTGLIGVQFLMRTLSDNGRPDIAYEIASQTTYPSWGYMVSQGATTIWELWNGNTAEPSMNSGNHLMLVGDLNIWFYEYLAGIRADPDKPAFKHLFIRPTPVEGLTYARATHESPYGLISSHWKRAGTQLTLDITVPPNTTATVYVPAAQASSVAESGVATANSKGVKFVRMEAGAAVYEVVSGSYSFTSQLPASGAK
jgi:alpha-L-rhamnosidase